MDWCRKIEIGKHAVVHGISNTVKNLASKYPGLTKQTVCDFNKLVRSAEEGESSGLTEKLESRKRGRKYILPDELMKKLLNLLRRFA